MRYGLSLAHLNIISIKTILLVAVGFLTAGVLRSQDTGTVRGTVTSPKGEPVENARIYVRDLAKDVYTSADGTYEIDLPADTLLLLEINHVSFNEWFQRIELKPGVILNLDPTLQDRALKGVVIEDERRRRSTMQSMPILTQRINPSVNQGIENVLLSGLGVSMNSELGTAYSVRGGSYDENLVYVNDVEVYRPFLARAGQQEGLSFANPDMVGSINFSAGGFSAKYGDKLSSVLDIKYKKPSDFGGAAYASMLGGSATIEAASDNRRLTQITGFRYQTNQYLLGSLDTQGDYRPAFTDLQTYWTYDVTEKFELSFLGNYANNKYNFEPISRQTDFGTFDQALRFNVFFDGQERTQFETFFGAVSANIRPNRDMMLKFTGSAYQTYEQEYFDILGSYNLGELDRDLGSDDFGEVTSSIGTGGFLQHARNDLDARVLAFNHRGFLETGNRYLQWGVRAQRELIDDELNEWDMIDSAGYSVPQQPSDQIVLQNVIRSDNSIESTRLMAYVTNEWEWTFENDAELSTEVGIRGQHWTWNEETVISPRGIITYKPDWYHRANDDGERLPRDILFRFAAGYYYQPPFYREMRRFDGSLNQDIEAQRSIHFILGSDVNFMIWDRPFKFQAEAYYKQLDNLIPYEIDNVRLRYFGDNLAEGYATGLDLKINGEFVEGIESWAALSFLKTEENLFNDSFQETVNGQGEPTNVDELVMDTVTRYPGYIPRPNDRRVFFSMLFQDEMPQIPSLRVALSFVYGTGLPFGPPTQNRYQDTGRMPSYRRVDIGFSKVFIEPGQEVESKWFDWMEHAWISLEVFNLFDISNTISYTWIRDAESNQYAIPNYLTGRRLNLKLAFRW